MGVDCSSRRRRDEDRATRWAEGGVIMTVETGKVENCRATEEGARGVAVMPLDGQFEEFPGAGG